ncbi:MAG: sugar phosphate isomerase/epimerase, partial [Spirochaetales bacterium]|nr:sugar phosphate isomerase/epimerase [Spirochaetales bacterium]
KNAGFTHINWNPDAGCSYMYGPSEMKHIAEMIESAGLLVKSIHAAHGHHHIMEISSSYQDKRKDITSFVPWRREAGVELVKNRIELAEHLKCDNIVLHIPLADKPLSILENKEEFFKNLYISLDQLRPIAESHGVTVAIENIHDSNENTEILLDSLFDKYPESYMGWCYDSGHAVNTGLSLSSLRRFGKRMIAMHLHDNFSSKDDHLLPGTGNMDWDIVSELIAGSSYQLPLNFETPPERYSVNRTGFYERAFKSIKMVTEKVQTRRKALE